MADGMMGNPFLGLLNQGLSPEQAQAEVDRQRALQFASLNPQTQLAAGLYQGITGIGRALQGVVVHLFGVRTVAVAAVAGRGQVAHVHTAIVDQIAFSVVVLPAHIAAVRVHSTRGCAYREPNLLYRQTTQDLALPTDVKAADTAQVQATGCGQGLGRHRTAPKVLCSTAKLRIRGC